MLYIFVNNLCLNLRNIKFRKSHGSIACYANLRAQYFRFFYSYKVSPSMDFPRTHSRVRIDGYGLLSNVLARSLLRSFFPPSLRSILSGLSSCSVVTFCVLVGDANALVKEARIALKRAPLSLSLSEERETTGGRKGGPACWLRVNYRYARAIWPADIYTTLYRPFRTWTMGHAASRRVPTSVRW